MRKKIKLYLLSLLLFGGILGLVLSVAELVLRQLALSGAAESRDHVRETEVLPATFKPHFRGRIWDIPFATNSYGFRDEEEFPRQHGPEEIRILSLGDSIGFGLGIPAPDHYTQVAERLLQPRTDRQVRVVNGGGQGYSPSGYAAFLREAGLALQPDLVVVEIELCNDVTDEALIGRLPDPRIPQLPAAVTGGRYVVSWDGNLLATYSVGPYWWEKTYLYTDFLRRWLNLRQRFGSEPFQGRPGATYYSLGFDQGLLTTERLEQGWQGMMDALQGMRLILQERGIPFLLMIMPSRYVYEEGAPDHRDFSLELLDRAEGMASQRGLHFFCLIETIRQGGGAALFFDFAHLTVEGNRVVGERLSREIAPLLGLEKESSAEEPTPPDPGA